MAHKSDFVPADIGLQLTGLAESGRIIGTDLPEEDGAQASALESGQLKLSHGRRSDLWEQARPAIYFFDEPIAFRGGKFDPAAKSPRV
jgi:hypothetical protein